MENWDIKEIYREFRHLYETAQPKVDEPWYAIDGKWIAKFNLAAKRNKNDFKQPISNTRLLKSKYIHRNLLMPSDFMVIPESAWKYLDSKFTAGPEYKIPVFLNPKTQIAELLVYLPQISVTYKGETKVLHFNYYLTYYDLLKEACSQFNLPINDCELLKEDVKSGSGQVTLNNIIAVDDKSISQSYHINYKGKDQPSALENNKFKFSKLFSRIPSNRQGLVGFVNRANICFFNSIMQCLVHTTPLVSYVLSENFKKDLNGKPDKVKAADLFRDYMNQIWSSRSSKMDLYDLSLKFQISTIEFRQEDSHELLQKVFEDLIEATNTGTRKTIAISESSDQSSEKSTADKFINEFRIANKTPIADMVYHFTKNEYICSNCHKSDIKFENGWVLFAPIPESTINLTIVPAGTFSTPIKISVPVPQNPSYNSYVFSVKTVVQTSYKLVFSLNGKFVIPTKNANYIVYEIPDTEDALTLLNIEVADGHQFVPMVSRTSFNYDMLLAKLWSDKPQPPNKEIEENMTFNPKRLFDSKRYELIIPNDYTLNQDYYQMGLKLTNEPIVAILNQTEIYGEKGFTWNKLTEITDAGNVYKDLSVDDCLKEMLSDTVVEDKKCPFCGNKCKATLRSSLYKTPEILIIVLKRFSSVSGILTKIDNKVDVPLELTIGGQEWCKDMEQEKYNLYAVSNHLSSVATFGHYTAVVKHSQTGQWYIANDENISVYDSINENMINKSYVLFYQKSK